MRGCPKRKWASSGARTRRHRATGSLWKLAQENSFGQKVFTNLIFWIFPCKWWWNFVSGVTSVRIIRELRRLNIPSQYADQPTLRYALKQRKLQKWQNFCCPEWFPHAQFFSTELYLVSYQEEGSMFAGAGRWVWPWLEQPEPFSSRFWEKQRNSRKSKAKKNNGQQSVLQSNWFKKTSANNQTYRSSK